MLIDAHCHLDFTDFDSDREAVIEAARRVGVGHFVVPGTQRAHWKRVLALGERRDVSVALGLHPYFIDAHRDADLDALAEMLDAHPEVVGLGECGIDARFDDTLSRQWHYFEAQLALAKRFNLPIVVHCVQANDQVAKCLKEEDLPARGLIHAFAGSAQQAQRFIDLGYVLGFGGVTTFARAKRVHEAVRAVPDDSFVLETDSPDMPLAGYQGQRNEPSRVALVARHIATLRGVDEVAVARQTSRTAERLFGLK